ncbi:MAG: hypothetical protein KF775_05310 [Cyclobacteriaceae bacterium]|nr:hypothetical protein [Cyclobacteriaceae bacterium]
MVQLEPIFAPALLVGVSLVLLFLFTVLEIKRKAKLLAARLVAVVLLVLSVLFYLLQPAVRSNAVVNGVLLLTQNYLAVQVDSVLAQRPDLQILLVPEAAPYKSAARLNSVNELPAYASRIRIVMGDGLPKWALPNSDFEFVKGKKPEGIVNLNKPVKIFANRKTTLTGLWRGEATMLHLLGPGGALDSVKLESGTQPFRLSFKAQQTGMFLFSIKASATNTNDILPIEVLPTRSLAVLVLQSYPSAETRYLKKFLIELGNYVAVRTQVSATNYHTEFGNGAARTLNRITPELLREFDLVVLANEATLTKADQGSLERAVREGLGLLWLCTNDELQKPFAGFEPIAYASDTARVRVEGKEIVLPAVAGHMKNNLYPIIATANRTVSGYKIAGVGKMGVQLLQETYALLAQGEPEVYAAIWTPVVETLARTNAVATKIQIENDFPIYPNEPIELNVISSHALPEVALDSIALPLREDAVIDGYWTTTFWTTRSGWYAVTSTDSAAAGFYVSKPNTWQALRSTTLQNLNYTSQSKTGEAAHTVTLPGEAHDQPTHKISSLWFFILFLVAAGFLWLAPKL